jgi:tetratricopeptide (TPR) repeat protein
LTALLEKRLEDAITFADAAVRLDPAINAAHYYRAAACWALERMDCALESAHAIIENGGDRQFPRIYLITGNDFAARGDLRAAAREYGRLINLEPRSRAAAAAASWIARETGKDR